MMPDMETDADSLIFETETYAIRGAIFEVYKVLGIGEVGHRADGCAKRRFQIAFRVRRSRFPCFPWWNPPPSLSAKVLPRTPRDPRLKQEVIAVNDSDAPLFSISHSFLFPSDLNCAIMGVVYGKGSKHEKQISFDECVGGPPVERMGGY